MQAAWTMMAEAAEYRKSMATDKAMAETQASLELWGNRELVLDGRLSLQQVSRDLSFGAAQPGRLAR